MPAVTAVLELSVRRIAGALGAEVAGVDLARPLAPDSLAALRAAWLEHQVLFFRDQALTSAQFMAFARAFGTPVEYPFVQGLEGYPEIIEVKKLEHETANFGGIWHSDTAYLERPPMASMLLAREIPPQGGDTLFASMTAAYDALSPGLQRMLEGLKAVNSSAKADVTRTREDRIRSDGRVEAKKEYVAEHPVVRSHPETGRKALYVNRLMTEEVEGIPEAEGDALLARLFEAVERSPFVYEHVWRPGDLLIWDNRSVQHARTDYPPEETRLLRRVGVEGDVPF